MAICTRKFSLQQHIFINLYMCNLFNNLLDTSIIHLWSSLCKFCFCIRGAYRFPRRGSQSREESRWGEVIANAGAPNCYCLFGAQSSTDKDLRKRALPHPLRFLLLTVRCFLPRSHVTPHGTLVIPSKRDRLVPFRQRILGRTRTLSTADKDRGRESVPIQGLSRPIPTR